MTPEEIKQIRNVLAVAIEQQQRINRQIIEGKITLAQLSAAYLELQVVIPFLERVLTELEPSHELDGDEGQEKISSPNPDPIER
ncbi:hypothetical protein [Nitrolancea hollandica]|uniref:Uncharacterized protein n=1 Tax=Nitrolancea hollandica Lb TaxID=1129897 RepID=I4EJD8_9BACT|nr:hypothetical protein [Nitrolancea hollandica]CCF84800.1 hypothetical protein NITHO_3970008 [Nitrolancea hollandica Lb]